ncbi:MAG TPA: ATP-dependent DNA helicase RecG [Pyrinomonadaceae bacterium]|nr:ATP-dependent DNA helicase RecG [Pyrinomonadaceae bacterium]
MTLTLDTPIIEFHQHGISNLSSAMARKLAMAVAGESAKSDLTEATVEDLINYFPMRYEDRSNLLPIDQLYDGIEASVLLHVRVSGGFQVGKNRSAKAPPLYIFEISASDAERRLKPVVVLWFVSGRQAQHVINYYKDRFQRGTRFVAYGKWEWDGRRNTFVLKIQKPDELEVLPPAEGELFTGESGAPAISPKGAPDDEEDNTADPQFAMIHTARRVPVYRKLGPFLTKRLREIMFAVVQNLDRAFIKENLPAEMLKEHSLVPRADALAEIHFPPEDSSIVEYEGFRSRAHRRLIFEEFFWLVFALQLVRGERQKEPKGTVIELPKVILDRMKALAPFELTEAQHRVIRQILSDMTSDAPMNRLIQGDVGSGKTIVAFMAMFAAAENSYQAAMMAPTEILAEQHARNAERIFAGTGYKVALLKGSMRAPEKRKAHEAIAAGEAQIIIGTHAVIQDAVTFRNLGLAVIDEQHRFGVLQRSALRELGYNPDIIVMTATPIPRSLAMTIYGDLDVSVIDELPPGRTPIKTVVVGDDQRDGVYRGMAREIDLGRQVYIVYPLIQESEKVDLKAATKMFEELRDKTFRKYRVGLLHGKMKPADKEAVMREFVAGEMNILVSTTVIEVGVDVPNASLMVIEHAERFGLSQLHQLRGRVGRRAEKSFCVLLTGDKKTAVAKERLGIMEETTDGFRIAEKDLEIRGQGEILGTRQAGIQSFKVANIVRDFEILDEARQAAELYLGPKRTSGATAALIKRVKDDPRLTLANVG